MCGGWQVHDSSTFVAYDSWFVRTDSAGCVIDGCGFPAFTTATIDIGSDGEATTFILSPNPASTDLTITFDDDINTFDQHYTITTVAGIPFIRNKQLSLSGSIDISFLPQGLYFLTITDLQTAKFVKGE
jgi:hypothetical protein